MSLIKNKKEKIPIYDFLKYTPKRRDLEWSKNDKGLVEIKVPKFKSNFGKSFCKLVKKDTNFTAKMDKLGTIVWENCDGKTTVERILEKLKKEFPDEEKLDERLFYFLYQMNKLDYIEY